MSNAENMTKNLETEHSPERNIHINFETQHSPEKNTHINFEKIFKKEICEEKTYFCKKELPNFFKDGYFSINFQSESSMGVQYLTKFIGILFLVDENSENNQKEIGRITFYKIHWDIIVNKKEDLFVCLDDESEELGELALIMLSMIDETKNDIFLENQLWKDDDLWEGLSFLFISRIKIEKEFQGFGLGLFMIDKTKSVFTSCEELILIKPFPLQYEGKGRVNNEKDFNADLEKLFKYYAKIGFKKIGFKNDVVFMILDTKLKNPEIEDVLPHFKDELSLFP